jgi:hypothetical protein
VLARADGADPRQPRRRELRIRVGRAPRAVLRPDALGFRAAAAGAATRFEYALGSRLGTLVSPVNPSTSIEEEAKMIVKRVGPLSVAKNAAVLYAVLGLIVGAMFSLAAVAGAFSGGDDTGVAAGIAGIVGVGAIVIAPIFYACIGFVGALIGAALYNLVAGMVGGIELEVE